MNGHFFIHLLSHLSQSRSAYVTNVQFWETSQSLMVVLMFTFARSHFLIEVTVFILAKTKGALGSWKEASRRNGWGTLQEGRSQTAAQAGSFRIPPCRRSVQLRPSANCAVAAIGQLQVARHGLSKIKIEKNRKSREYELTDRKSSS